MNKIIMIFLMLITPASTLASSYKVETRIPEQSLINEYLKCRERARNASASIGREIYDAVIKENDNSSLSGVMSFMLDLGGGITGIYSASAQNAPLYGQSDERQYQGENITCR